MIKALAPGLILLLIGGCMVLGPMMLPRSFFGELGHGDGFGLVGMILWGAPIAIAGIVALFVGAARHQSNKRWGDGEG